jgi:hypothetical protein
MFLPGIQLNVGLDSGQELAGMTWRFLRKPYELPGRGRAAEDCEYGATRQFMNEGSHCRA